SQKVLTTNEQPERELNIPKMGVLNVPQNNENTQLQSPSSKKVLFTANEQPERELDIPKTGVLNIPRNNEDDGGWKPSTSKQNQSDVMSINSSIHTITSYVDENENEIDPNTIDPRTSEVVRRASKVTSVHSQIEYVDEDGNLIDPKRIVPRASDIINDYSQIEYADKDGDHTDRYTIGSRTSKVVSVHSQIEYVDEDGNHIDPSTINRRTSKVVSVHSQIEYVDEDGNHIDPSTIDRRTSKVVSVHSQIEYVDEDGNHVDPSNIDGKSITSFDTGSELLSPRYRKTRMMSISSRKSVISEIKSEISYVYEGDEINPEEISAGNRIEIDSIQEYISELAEEETEGIEHIAGPSNSREEDSGDKSKKKSAFKKIFDFGKK
ncbi:2040_t:CDS:1, partial [Acaulospora morrowiae]